MTAELNRASTTTSSSEPTQVGASLLVSTGPSPTGVSVAQGLPAMELGELEPMLEVLA